MKKIRIGDLVTAKKKYIKEHGVRFFHYRDKDYSTGYFRVVNVESDGHGSYDFCFEEGGSLWASANYWDVVEVESLIDLYYDSKTHS